MRYIAQAIRGGTCVAVFLALYSLSFAQGATVDALTVSLEPSYPKPYSVVTVTPGSTLIDLSASTVTISVNGKVVQQGSGSQPAQVSVGGLGQATTITVTATNEGKVYTKKLTVRPADVALISEPFSTTHPFYKGGSLLASNGRVRLVAMPDFRTGTGASIPPKNLVYTWRNGDQVLESASGIGKYSITATAPNRYRDSVVTVTVATSDQSLVGQSSIEITPTDPIVRIYQNDPLLGPLFNLALAKNTTLSSEEKTFRAVPYYFSETPSINWMVNGTASQGGADITVRPTGSGVGTALLAVAAKAKNFPQQAQTTLSVAFGVKSSSGIFGL